MPANSSDDTPKTSRPGKSTAKPAPLGYVSAPDSLTDGSGHVAVKIIVWVLVATLLFWLGMGLSIVVPDIIKNVRNMHRGTPTQARMDIANLDDAILKFKADHGRFPTMAEGLQTLIKQPTRDQNWRGPYLTHWRGTHLDSLADKQVIPLDPWDHDYVYLYPGTHNTDGYDLLSPGRDGKPGTADDIVNWSEAHAN